MIGGWSAACSSYGHEFRLGERSARDRSTDPSHRLAALAQGENVSGATPLVRDRMSSPVFRLRPEDRLDVARALMLERHIRHLPVESSGRVVGVVSLGDLLATLPGLPPRNQPVLLRELTAADRM